MKYRWVRLTTDGAGHENPAGMSSWVLRCSHDQWTHRPMVPGLHRSTETSWCLVEWCRDRGAPGWRILQSYLKVQMPSTGVFRTSDAAKLRAEQELLAEHARMLLDSPELFPW